MFSHVMPLFFRFYALPTKFTPLPYERADCKPCCFRAKSKQKQKTRMAKRMCNMALRHSFETHTDLSTPDYFQFVFHCEQCGAGVKSEKYRFNTEGLTHPFAENVRTLLWTRQHEAAKARARSEAKFEFNICRICGHKTCNECFYLFAETTAGICTCCKDKLDKNGFAPPVDERIRTILWTQQHEESYERANNREAGAWFNRGPCCGCRVCDDCLYSGTQDSPESCRHCIGKSP